MRERYWATYKAATLSGGPNQALMQQQSHLNLNSQQQNYPPNNQGFPPSGPMHHQQLLPPDGPMNGPVGGSVHLDGQMNRHMPRHMGGPMDGQFYPPNQGMMPPHDGGRMMQQHHGMHMQDNQFFRGGNPMGNVGYGGGYMGGRGFFPGRGRGRGMYRGRG